MLPPALTQGTSLLLFSRKLTRLFSVLLALSLPALLAAMGAKAAPAGRTLYVSPKGDDSNEGSLTQPWRTLEQSFGKLEPGDTLLMRGGTYAEEVRAQFLAVATPDQPILVRAYPGITLADVHAALAYYYDNRASVDRDIHESEQLVARMKAAAGTGLLDQLR